MLMDEAAFFFVGNQNSDTVIVGLSFIRLPKNMTTDACPRCSVLPGYLKAKAC